MIGCPEGACIGAGIPFTANTVVCSISNCSDETTDHAKLDQESFFALSGAIPGSRYTTSTGLAGIASHAIALAVH